jgi:succinate-semialdehyde dehydrogenase/glutarate-semialdehyde dehydrogenase
MNMSTDDLKAAEAAPESISEPKHELPCLNPATGEQLGSLTMCTPEQVPELAARARAAFPGWRDLGFDERAKVMRRARDLFLDQKNEILDLLVEETGKARCDAIADIMVICETIHYFASKGKKFLKDERLRSRLWLNKGLVNQYSPRGLILNISPWNYPLDLAWSPLIPALLAGNCVINKPSEFTPRISLKFRKILCEAGVPEDVVSVVVGKGDVGAALIPEVDFVGFTGSSATGRKVGALCGSLLIPFTLELGGKDPAIVLDDADIERAANGIVWGAFFNSGQTCIAVERVYVSKEVYMPFVEAVVEKTKALRQGIDKAFDVDVGSMCNGAQLEIVETHVQDAVEKGAMVRAGGRRNPDHPNGFFYEPTVLTDVDHSMKIMTEETFGPVLPIMSVRDGAEALEHANRSPYGLNASVWTRDREWGASLARKIQSGQVCINECLVSGGVVEAPFGGVKESGVGRRRGPDEIRKYCNQKVVLRDIFGLKREAIWYPYSPGVGNTMMKLLGFLYRSGLGNKIRHLKGDVKG